MNKITKILTLATLILMTANISLASELSNYSEISQAGVEEEVTNEAGIEQIGEESYASIEIVGEDNQALITQGSLKSETVSSGEDALINSRENFAAIVQFGDSNIAGIEQYGNGNTAIISQNGNMQTAMITQNGAGNTAMISQR